MRFNFTLKTFISTIVCMFLFPALLNSQTYSFKNYGTEYNIPDGFIYTINQSDNGFLWVGTGKGLLRFDGFNYYSVEYPDSSLGRNPNVSLKDKSGTLWFGCNDGTVFYTSGNKLRKVLLSNSKSISGILEGPDGLIYIIPQGEAIYSVNPLIPEEIHQYNFSSHPVLYSASFTSSGNLLIGTRENILICSLGKDSVFVKGVIEGFDNSAINAIHKTEESSKFLVGTEDNGLFLLTLSGNNNLLTRFRDHPEWSALRVKSISEDSGNNFWISTFGSGVIQFQMSDNNESVKSVRLFNSDSGLGSDDTKLVFQDAEGNYWFGLFGKGVSMLTSYSFGFYTPGKNLQNNILFVDSLDNNYILGTPSGFHIFDPVAGKSLSFTSLTAQIGGVQITSYNLDKEKNLWIGTKGNGLYLRNNSGVVRQFYRNGDSGADEINDIEIDGNNIWLATINGVIVIDKSSRTEKHKFDITNGLPPKSINKIFLDINGNAYIGAESDRLYMIDREFKISSGNSLMYGNTINKVLSFSKSKRGEIWAATGGNGVFGFLSDSVSAFNRSNGLMSQYCYSILADSENNVWIGHEKGFSRLNSETGIVSVYGTDYAKNGVCNPDGMFESADRKIFIGTTEGLIIYDRQKDIKSSIPPFNNIISIVVNNGDSDVVYDYQPSIELKFKKYRITIQYSGINFSSPDKVYYSTFLENYDPLPSKMSTSREVAYSLSDGKYKFNLVSVNESGLSQDSPVSFDININKPWWRKWWSILAEILFAAGTVILIIRERDKAQKKVQEYLETELAARTSVVLKQKGEIELQNIEITDSINYAKRIQTSILPDISKLKESFKDAFILFHPRDIVSGDFYWFDKITDEKFVLVCADSTGHGVPGAFMSMIGSTLLQDIVTRKGITKPSDILTLLDKQIFSTLNQNAELGVSNDGMDMVICEFNVKTRHIRFASAMRPVIIVMGGDSFYIKGNRSSVGGESVNEKYFDDQEYYLSEGDTIYLFSDGLPDQFGGPDGKKMKIARLKRVIEQVTKLPMNEQKEAFAKYYFNWKGAYDQVDDILLMGVKV
jgi:ligand-binding sensor domain-containing protein/serine phosphatase RsbU (regulator of sigma subunit)